MSERNEQPDAFEAELAALVPAEPSAGLHDRIGRALSGRAVPTRPSHAWYIRGLAAAAACVVAATAVVVWRVSRPDPQIGVPVATTYPAPAAVTVVDQDRPALAVYRRALHGSPAALDDLLDRHAARSLGGNARGGTRTARVTASSEFGLLR